MTRAEISALLEPATFKPFVLVTHAGRFRVLILTLSTYPLMTPRSLNPASLWCTQKPGLRDLWSCRVSITLKSNQSPVLERGTSPKRRQGFFGSVARRLDN